MTQSGILSKYTYIHIYILYITYVGNVEIKFDETRNLIHQIFTIIHVKAKIKIGEYII